MDQYPTEEEEYELRYQEELELLNEMEDSELMYGTLMPATSKATPITLDESSAIESPEVSQISQPVNRRLFGTPNSQAARRAVSTPIARRMSDIEELIAPDAIDAFQNIGLKQKRKLERDLFGDIDDLEGGVTYVDPVAKKKKLEEDRDRETIERVLEARKMYRALANASNKPKLSQLEAIHDFKMRNLSYTVPKWPFLAIRRSDHERVYVRYHSVEYETKHINEVNTFNKGYGGLLGESKQDIWNDAREIVLRRMTATTAQNVPALIDVPEQGLVGNDNLWVEKYKPKKYFDLLSDEGTNRSLLLWLKMWDKIVFGKEFIPRENKIPTKGFSNFNKTTGKFEVNGGWKRSKKQGLNTNTDSYGRPMQKVALLCGPPGLGKTTLAHIIARHAGYQVQEVNASDDRSPDAFKLALENGTQMTSVLNIDNKPNCIILDEIDGAPKASIEFLIKFISDSVAAKPQKKGAKVKKNILKRPIVCICNDLYEPALRQLRQVAFVLSFPPINSSRLAERLGEIARKERIKTDFGTLIALSEKSGNDVRSCISTLQFFNALKKSITLTDVLNSNFGLKDRHRGLFDVWTSVFKIARPQKQLDANGSKDGGPLVTMTDMSVASRTKYVLDVVHSGGDYNILIQGVYENYLHQKMPDPDMNGVAESTRWFSFSDLLQHHIQHLQNYSVYPYLQYGFVAWHLLFATLAWPSVSFPLKGHEFNQKMTTQRQIFQSLRKGIVCGAYGMGRGHVILLDTVPMLKKILSPKLRSVASQLLSEKEKQELTHTVDILVDMGISFTQIKTAEGTFKFHMEPDIDLLSQFPGFTGITLSYLGKQQLGREVEVERMRRSAPKVLAESEKKPTKRPIQLNLNARPVNQVTARSKDAKSKTSMDKRKIVKDFFGRVVIKSTQELEKETPVDPVVKSPIWFKYKLGFTNAVRKDVTILDLL